MKDGDEEMFRRTAITASRSQTPNIPTGRPADGSLQSGWQAGLCFCGSSIQRLLELLVPQLLKIHEENDEHEFHPAATAR